MLSDVVNMANPIVVQSLKILFMISRTTFAIKDLIRIFFQFKVFPKATYFAHTLEYRELCHNIVGILV